MFLEFSRNRLADDELPPGDSSNFYLFLGSKEEPPGGELCTARRRVTTNPDSRCLLELPGGDEHTPGDADQFGFGFGVLSVLIGF